MTNGFLMVFCIKNPFFGIFFAIPGIFCGFLKLGGLKKTSLFHASFVTTSLCEVITSERFGRF
jgi:hypothetical protein